MSTQTTDRQALEQLSINTIRTLSMDAVQKANSGHPGTPMALAPVAYTLYARCMRHNPGNAGWPDRDRFVLSAGHASMLLYSILYLSGYGLTLDDLKNFRQLGSPTAGHPEYGHAAGIETTTGPLGQGISTAVGMALAERMLAARFNREGHEVVDHWTYTIASDGDMQEGVQAEAASLAGHLGLARLIAFWDDNHISIEGDTALSFDEDVAKRYEAYGWHVQNLGEDVEPDRIEAAVNEAKGVGGRPSLIVIRTHIAPGAPNKQDTASAHGSPLGEEEIRLTKEAYGWPPDKEFYVPDEVLEHFREVQERGAQSEREWDERMDGYKADDPDAHAELTRIFERRLPEGWDADVPKFHVDTGMVATRKSSHEVLQWAAKQVPELVGGSADLAPSTLTLIDGAESVQKGAYGGRNLHFGIREHGMGAIVNGLVLHYFRAYGATFLIFSDYMKGAIRLAALMRIPSIFVYTHDSIGLGEDGPTHQPVEQLTALRATPNLNVVRPAGANEVALAWRFALASTETPTCFALSRQGVPTWNPAGVPRDAIERGAYVLRDSYKEGADPDLILMGSGSEVHIANAAADLLEAEGIATRLVSVPCMDTFAAQDSSYRDSVLPPGCRARLAVEAASPLSWYRWVGDAGDVIGMETFGASGPQKALYEHFGFTPENVVERAKKVVEGSRG
ncbi:MAG: transketolase [Solirubrobacteraceae bacterium]|jgi:transketolase|nr:transketolase [Solirubrobacteraceae bacterium]